MKKRIALAVAALSATVAAPAHAGSTAPVVPNTIAVGAGHKVFLVGHAAGVQKYTCNGTSWTLTGPSAVLYNDQGSVIATHSDGPSWQAKDGSHVVGARVDGVTVDPTAIPWLLLSAKGFSGPDGDRLAGTTFIQRVATVGGLAPTADTCRADNLGAVKQVPYTADYYFWKSA